MNLLQTGSISVVVRYIMAEQVSVGQKRGAEKAAEVAQLRRRGIQFTFCISRI